jgi:hypothetical protein
MRGGMCTFLAYGHVEKMIERVALLLFAAANIGGGY